MKRVLIAIIVMSIAAAANAGNCFWITPPTSMTITSTYSVFSTSSYSLSQPFSFQCSPNTAATLTLTRGINSTAYTPWRTAMIQNPPVGYTGALLNYNLYNTTNQVWGDGTGGSVSVTFQAVAKDKVYDTTDGAIITALALFGQDVPPGTYSDTITATLTYPGGPATAVFSISTTVIPECTVGTFGVSFGAYDPLVANASAPLDAQTPSGAPLAVNCTKSTAATIGLNTGLYASTSRQMRNTLDTNAFLQYDLYKDSGRSTVWDLSSTFNATSSSKLTALGGGYPVYGRIPGGQDAKKGDYRDTVQAVVNY